MKRTILVADDSMVVRAVVRDQLVGDGYEVTEARDGHEALEALRAAQPDVILLDVEMPVMNGFQVLAEMKQDPVLRDIPVVFLTARDRVEDLVEGLELGAHDYLRKPFEPSELTARVRAAVRVKALQDELRDRNVELERISRTDQLTGLWNRRHLEEHLQAVSSSAVRRNSGFGVLMIDIDHFKEVNDAEGHAAGDAVLREVAARLRAGVRDEDLMARWGGEEFLALLPDTTLQGAIAIAERLRRSIEVDPMRVAELRLGVTVSVGCAAGLAEPAALVERADRALYRAKEAGRNRVDSGDEVNQDRVRPAG